MNNSRALRYSVIAFGAALLVSAGTAATAATVGPDQNIDLEVEIQEIAEPGVLAMTVAPGSAALTEDGSTDLVRQFTGTLPTVTVTDTRDAADVPAGATWYVMGSASDFTAADATNTNVIEAKNLGWAPALQGETEGDPNISVGGDVAPSAPGLIDQELLYETVDSTATAGGAWSANAALKLQVPADVEPGSYSSVLTLSLFE